MDASTGSSGGTASVASVGGTASGWPSRALAALMGVVALLLLPVTVDSVERWSARRAASQLVERHQEVARASLATGDTGTALVALDAARRVAPEDAGLEIAAMRAAVAHAAANPRTLEERELPRLTHIAAVLEAIDGGPSRETLTVAGHVALREGKADRARARFEAAIAADPAYVHAHLALAALFREQKQPVDALAAYEAAVKSAPDDLTALNNLGVQYIDVERPVEGIAMFERALAKQDNLATRLNLADALTGLQRVPEARVHLERAVALAPRSALAHRRLGELLHKAQKLEEAERPLRTSLELQADPEVMQRLGLLYLDLQRYADAVEILNRLAGGQPDQPDPLFLLAKALEGAGDPGRAVQAYQAFLRVAERLPGEAARVKRVREQVAFLTSPPRAVPPAPEGEAPAPAPTPTPPGAPHTHDGLAPHVHE